MIGTDDPTAPAAPAAADTASPSPYSSPCPPASPTILLVEDNADDVVLTRRALRKLAIGATLVVATDGDQAVDYLDGAGRYADRDAHPWPALVLLDWKLPRRSGMEVLQWIRAQAPMAGLPVVVLTSSLEEEDLQRAYTAGANSYVQKPLAGTRLAELLAPLTRYWLELNRVPAAATAPCR